MISSTELSEAFVEMADTLVDDFDIVEFLSNLTVRAAAVSGASAVGLMLADHVGRARFMAANNESGKLIELFQLQNAEGPCLDCITTGRPVVNADLHAAVDIWPVFAPRALLAGFRSVHAFPLRLRGQRIGALNLFGGSDSVFSDDEMRAVQALADVATVAILQQRTIARAEEVTEQLQGALSSRIVIEQAKGAFAQAENISLAEAFERLRSSARKLRAQARRRRSADARRDGAGAPAHVVVIGRGLTPVSVQRKLVEFLRPGPGGRPSGDHRCGVSVSSSGGSRPLSGTVASATSCGHEGLRPGSRRRR